MAAGDGFLCHDKNHELWDEIEWILIILIFIPVISQTAPPLRNPMLIHDGIMAFDIILEVYRTRRLWLCH